MAKEGYAPVCRHLEILYIKGENRHVECSASLLRDAEGNPSKVLILQRDVTMEKKYQAKYFQAERMATVGVLAEGVAHEINNPLTSIRGFAEALRRRFDTLATCLLEDGDCDDMMESYKEYLEIILIECKRCSEIVQNLLTFGHREVRSLSIVNLNDVVGNSIKLLHPRLEGLAPGIISLHLSAQEPCLLGHPGELMQVILNLVHNALYAVRESGEIHITTKVERNLVTLTVADSGHGIAKENLDKLFDPFFTTKPPGQGIGVGLSTCYNIIKKHGGDIGVESTQGQGAVFEIVLPYFEE
jgi:signal transduction histidine kinase